MLSNMERSSSFWAGFTDCTEEAITFLLESENFTEADPVIQGLREYLRHKKQELGFKPIGDGSSSCNNNNLDSSVNESMELDMSIDRTDEGYNSSLNITSDISTDISFSTEDIIPTQSITSDTYSDINDVILMTTNSSFPSSYPSICPQPSSNTVTVNTVTPIMHSQIITSSVNTTTLLNQSQPTQSHPADVNPTYLDPFQDPVSLAILAQNNPEIASVAQELFQLLSEDCDESLFCDEEFDDEYDDEDLQGILSGSQQVVSSPQWDSNGNVGIIPTLEMENCDNNGPVTESSVTISSSVSDSAVYRTNDLVEIEDKENMVPVINVCNVSHSSSNKSQQSLGSTSAILRLSPQNC